MMMLLHFLEFPNDFFLIRATSTVLILKYALHNIHFIWFYNAWRYSKSVLLRHPKTRRDKEEGF